MFQFFFYGGNHTKPFPKHVWACTTYSTICVHISESLPDTERNISGVTLPWELDLKQRHFAFIILHFPLISHQFPSHLLFLTLAYSCQN